ncbi:hypothetical protein K2X30_02350 [bacterium]|nr:hypothetical protein [bacterium]
MRLFFTLALLTMTPSAFAAGVDLEHKFISEAYLGEEIPTVTEKEELAAVEFHFDNDEMSFRITSVAMTYKEFIALPDCTQASSRIEMSIALNLDGNQSTSFQKVLAFADKFHRETDKNTLRLLYARDGKFRWIYQFNKNADPKANGLVCLWH